MPTPVAYTKIKIISLALVNCGKGPINTIAGAGEFAQAAEDVFDLLYPSLITSGQWRFSVKTQELSRNVVDPDINWAYSWELPADYLAMIRLDPHVNYNIFGTNVYTNTLATNLYAVYFYQPEIEILPPYFVRYFTYQLAADLAWSIARDKALAKVYEEKAQQAFMQGQVIDAKSHPNIAIASAPYVEVRNTGARRGYRGLE